MARQSEATEIKFETKKQLKLKYNKKHRQNKPKKDSSMKKTAPWCA